MTVNIPSANWAGMPGSKLNHHDMIDRLEKEALPSG